MARDFLSIPGKYTLNYTLKYYKLKLIFKFMLATSVPIERAFSAGTDLVTQKRCSLSAETIQACMCLQAWWRDK